MFCGDLVGTADNPIANSAFARSGGASRGLARTAGLAAGLKWSKMVYNGVCTLYKSIKLFPQQFGLEAWWSPGVWLGPGSRRAAMQTCNALPQPRPNRSHLAIVMGNARAAA